MTFVVALSSQKEKLYLPPKTFAENFYWSHISEKFTSLDIYSASSLFIPTFDVIKTSFTFELLCILNFLETLSRKPRSFFYLQWVCFSLPSPRDSCAHQAHLKAWERWHCCLFLIPFFSLQALHCVSQAGDFYFLWFPGSSMFWTAQRPPPLVAVWDASF